MRKIKLIVKAGGKVAKKLVREGPRATYRGRSSLEWAKLILKAPLTVGPKESLRLVKRQILAINQISGSNLYFPNGMISGAETTLIKEWAKTHARKTTIVVCSYNDEAVLLPCIASIKATTNPKKTKIIIVDDYCQPTSRKFLRQFENDPQIRVIYREKNGGYTKAANTGMRAADKKHDVVFVNSDIVAHDGWLDALQFGAYSFGDSKMTGIVGAKLLYPDGRIQHGGAFRNTDNPEYFDHYYRFQPTDYGPANIPQHCLAVTGACFYVKRELLNKLGEFDESYGFAHEDADYCLQAWQEGYRVLYFPPAVLTHHESISRGKNTTISEKEQQSITHFKKKWGNWFDKRSVVNHAGKIRVIYVLQSMGYSGGIKHVFENANNLIKDGFAVEVWGLDAREIPWETHPDLIIREFKDYPILSEELAEQEAIKVATWWETIYPVWLGSVQKGIPVCFAQEFETWFYPNDPVIQSSVVASYRKEFFYLTIATYQQQELANIGLRSTYIPCGYDKEIYKPLQLTRERTVLALGRTFFQKNFPMTLKGWKRLGDDRPTLWLFGTEADQLAKHQSKIKSYGRASAEVVNQLYNTAGVFVQTSRHEGFCLPVLEALAAGCPVVCTDMHGNRDFCYDGKNCIIIEQEDDEALSKAIDRILTDTKLAQKLSKAGIETAKAFQWKTISKKVSAYYKGIANGSVTR